MGGDDVPNHRKTHARAFHVSSGRSAAAHKFAENSLALPIRDSGSAIAYADRHVARLLAPFDPDRRVIWRILDGVVDQIPKRDGNRFGIGFDPATCRAVQFDVPARAGNLRLELRYD